MKRDWRLSIQYWRTHCQYTIFEKKPRLHTLIMMPMISIYADARAIAAFGRYYIHLSFTMHIDRLCNVRRDSNLISEPAKRATQREHDHYAIGVRSNVELIFTRFTPRIYYAWVSRYVIYLWDENIGKYIRNWSGCKSNLPPSNSSHASWAKTYAYWFAQPHA